MAREVSAIRNARYILLAGGIVILILLAYFGSGLFSKAPFRDDGVRYLIGVSQSNLLDPWQVAMKEEMKKEAARHAEVKVIFYDAAEDDRKQRRDLANLVAQRVDLLIVLANNPRFLTDAVRRVYREGTPVVMMEYPILTRDYSLLIFADNQAIGRKAGQLAAALLGKKGGAVLEVQGDPESIKAGERKHGFRRGIQSNPRVKVNYVVVGFWSMDKTEVRVGEIYRKRPRPDLVFAHNDAMAVGAWKVARQNGLQINIISGEGLDTQYGGNAPVGNGILAATFRYPTGGREAIQYALRILQGTKVPKRLELPVTLVMKDGPPP